MNHITFDLVDEQPNASRLSIQASFSHEAKSWANVILWQPADRDTPPALHRLRQVGRVLVVGSLLQAPAARPETNPILAALLRPNTNIYDHRQGWPTATAELRSAFTALHADNISKGSGLAAYRALQLGAAATAVADTATGFIAQAPDQNKIPPSGGNSTQNFNRPVDPRISRLEHHAGTMHAHLFMLGLVDQPQPPRTQLRLDVMGARTPDHILYNLNAAVATTRHTSIASLEATAAPAVPVQDILPAMAQALHAGSILPPYPERF
jgi:hypothetical protein